MRGQFSHAFLTQSLSLKVPFRYVKELPFEHWDPEWFDACNPRGWLPMKTTFELLNNQGKTKATRAFKVWVEWMNSTKDIDDDKRESVSNDVLRNLLNSGYVWIPAIAWLLEQLDWTVVASLCVQTFGGQVSSPSITYPTSSSPVVLEKYKNIELAIMRENLLREYVRLEDVVVAAFSKTIDVQTITDHHDHVANIAVQLAKMLVESSFSSRPATQPYCLTPTNTNSKVIREGYLAHVVTMDLKPVGSQTKASLTNIARDIPWVRRFCSSSC